LTEDPRRRHGVTETDKGKEAHSTDTREPKLGTGEKLNSPSSSSYFPV